MDFQDIYFEPEYGELCRIIEGGSVEVFELKTDHGRVRSMFLKRPLPAELDPGQTYFDITTPYGYGGPLIMELTGDKDRLVREFSERFSRYCREEGIVCEFIRFHPLLHNAADFKDQYETVYMRKTVVTDLEGVTDPLLEQFSKSARKTIRRGLKDGARIEVIEKPDNLDAFMAIYYDTMDRNEAEDFYFFSKEYFDHLCHHLNDHFINVNIYLGEECIASGIYFTYDEIMQIHLSGTKREFLHLSPAYLLRNGAINWANEQGIRYVHHGGGVTNDPEDQLFQFKSRFTRNEPLDFHIGKKIYLPAVYEDMTEKSGKSEATYFPKYRARECQRK